MTRHNNRAEMSISEIIEDVKEHICDEYCRYTQEYRKTYTNPDEAEEKMTADRCSYCPLNRL